MGLDEVEKEILAAFSEVERPEPSELINPARADEDGAAQLRDELEGKNWHELDRGFDARSEWRWQYLSAKAYRYYLPALLVHPNGPNIFSFGPNFWRLYYHGQDEIHEYQTSLLTAKQYCAVCSRLGFDFDFDSTTDRPVKFRYAQALKWKWNRYDHPAVRASHDFYAEMESYRFPKSQYAEIQIIVDQIMEAFNETPAPSNFDPGGADYDDEPACYALEFSGKNWNTLHPDFLGNYESSLIFFSDEAFRYFLPAYLIADLLGNEVPEFWTNADPVFNLTYGLTVDIRREQLRGFMEEPLAEGETEASANEKEFRRAVDRFAAFNLQERRAIIAFLEYREKLEGGDVGVTVALDRYWHRSIG